MQPQPRGFLVALVLIALAGIVAGVVLAVVGYSSAGPFAVSAACVGVLGTIAAQSHRPEPTTGDPTKPEQRG